MKNFSRTIAGKTAAFIIWILSVCLLAGCVVSALVMTDNDLNFYTRKEEDIRNELIVENQLYPAGYDQLFSMLTGSENKNDGNLYQIINSDGQVLYTSSGAEEQQWQYETEYGVMWKNGTVEDIFPPSYKEHYDNSKDAEYYTVRIIITPEFQKYERVMLYQKIIHLAYSMRYWVYVIGFLAALAIVASFVSLMSASGKKPGSEEVHPDLLYFIPFDLMVCGCLMVGYLAAVALDSVSRLNDFGEMMAFGFLAVVALSVLLGLCMIAASRIKRGVFLKNTLVYKGLALAGRMLRWIAAFLKQVFSFLLVILFNIPLIWKAVIAITVICLYEFMVIAGGWNDGDIVMLGLTLEKLVLIPLALYFVICLRKLQTAGIALAEGNLSYHTDTKGMFWDLKKHGDNLNSIAAGMAKAVEEKMKSERMKTELITNVSHDLKTPLTSVINYAGLISQEKSDNEKIGEYSEVLVSQSEKLKRLIEDLVEASKASTGNLEVSLMPCDASVFISQVAGEYEEKLQACDLTLITKGPEKEIRIMADGRRMWRIFDNLMNNICKYAQPQTRVYLSLEEQDGQAVFIFKNTSRDKLDISEEELMERFTRGDSSRNTEGNGLGLSIARSMAELQNGSLKLDIDGDLFKAILKFPVIS
ncbi:MAG: HAMP domain-containing histidine kinase [Erysipelotrichaceae bacterium]|nr:HAMP domain-containing histidine kinase [Erysipelotrichaceae bacterium]